MRLKNSRGAPQEDRTRPTLLPRLSRQNLALLRTKPLTNSKQGKRERGRGRGSTALVRQEDCAKLGAHRCTARSKRTEAGTAADRTYDARSTAGAWLAQHARCRPSHHIWHRGGSTSKGALSASLAPFSLLPSSLYTSPQRRILTNSPAIPILTDGRRQRLQRPATRKRLSA